MPTPEPEDVLGPAVALTAVGLLEACVIVRDVTGALFVRAMTDRDILRALG